jgi:hypothetical protein
MPWKGLAWHAIHKSYGHLRQGQLAYLAPNVSQENAQPFVPHSRRTVNVRPDWTLAQIAMEPLFYNPHLSGRYAPAGC